MLKLPYLVPATAKWRGTLGCQLAQEQFAAYVAAIKPSEMEFKPRKVIIHNTASPNFTQWRRGKIYPNRMENLTGWYRDKEKWMAGPHLFVDDKGFWLFTPLWKQGTHSPSFNETAWGMEMVGDYETEPFDTGPGAKIRDNATFATAVLLQRLGLQVTNKTVVFHHEDPKTTHACPGKNVVKEDFLVRTGKAMKAL